MPKVKKSKEKLILIATDSNATQGTVPTKKNEVALMSYDLLIKEPYKYTEREFFHELHVVRRKRTDLNLNGYRLGRSKLVKENGWGIHFDNNGKIALVDVGSEKYRRLANSIKTVSGSRSASNKPLKDLENDLQNIDDDSTIKDTEKVTYRNARIGQGKYRNALFKVWDKKCAVTGCTVSELLIASHIKPWKPSNNEERLDKYNGFLLISNIDKAFDSGLITFDKSGRIVIYEKFTEADIAGIREDMRIDLKPGNEQYLNYHRAYVFQGDI